MEWVLTQTIEAGGKSGAIDDDNLKRVAVDTVVVGKAIAHPADARRCERAPKLIADLRRRSATMSEIGHMKSGIRFARCPLTGAIGDAIFAVLCGCGHNIQRVFAEYKALLSLIIAAIMATCIPDQRDRHQPLAA